MKKIVFIFGEENWMDSGFPQKHMDASRMFIIDYVFVSCIFELITVQNDNGTFAKQKGAKTWGPDYADSFKNYLKKAKEIKGLGKNIDVKDWSAFEKELKLFEKMDGIEEAEKRLAKIRDHYDINNNDLSVGYTFRLEDKILNIIWELE
ncbi:MAG: hypothetical protein HN913_01980 [Candidatus Marinimicrobia bacterium]|nr:hypothetical protein [Candidatus Neomarinimicrobiota bacterium]